MCIFCFHAYIYIHIHTYMYTCWTFTRNTLVNVSCLWRWRSYESTNRSVSLVIHWKNVQNRMKCCWFYLCTPIPPSWNTERTSGPPKWIDSIYSPELNPELNQRFRLGCGTNMEVSVSSWRGTPKFIHHPLRTMGFSRSQKPSFACLVFGVPPIFRRLCAGLVRNPQSSKVGKPPFF